MNPKTTNPLTSATNWYVLLTSGEATDGDRRDWEDWLKASAENERAWQKVESVTGRFAGLDSRASLSVLDRPLHERHAIFAEQRRRAIKHLSLLFMVGTSGWLAYQHKPWHGLMADFATAKGEIKHVTLQDGSKLVLNTNTTVAVQFDKQYRHIQLLQGEIYIETAKQPVEQHRPFIVTTEHGSATALGTQFSVRIHDKQSQVGVFKDAVEVKASDVSSHSVRLNAGEKVSFTRNKLPEKEAFDLSAKAWTQGFIIADKMPLKTFVDELSRYHTGVLRCDPAIADLTISGAFPLTDTDATLNSISQILPIRVESHTRYWTMIKPAQKESG